MHRPTKRQAETTTVIAALLGLLAAQIATRGPVAAAVWVVAVILIVSAINGLLWLARKVGR